MQSTFFTRKCPPVRAFKALDCSGVFEIIGLAIAPATNSASSILYYHCDVCWFARSIRRTCVASLAFRQHVETNVNTTVFCVRLSLSNYSVRHTSRRLQVSNWTPIATPLVYNATTPRSMQLYGVAGVQVVVDQVAGVQVVVYQVAGVQVVVYQVAGVQVVVNQVAGVQVVVNQVAGAQVVLDQVAGAQVLEQVAGAQVMDQVAGAQVLDQVAGAQVLDQVAGAHVSGGSSGGSSCSGGSSGGSSGGGSLLVRFAR